MRLLNARTFKLFEFFDDQIPHYAILSHTWGDEEITFLDVAQLESGQAGLSLSSKRAGFEKVAGCCRQALIDGLQYAWIDTCCIDKSSSAELSEAINSMFSWYQGAQVCYAYLSDVTWSPTGDSRGSRFAQSRWFTRGWTLQELLAPQTLIFYDAHWFPLGSKADRSLGIKAATGISAEYLTGKKRLHDASIAQRMSWAANRQTQRKEDIAYSLLGIFGVNMPMLYGEGAKAFIRLQEEIIKESRDLSIFAWGLKMPWSWHDGVFSPSPRQFLHCSEIEQVKWPSSCGLSEPYYFSTNKGLQIQLPVHYHRSSGTSFVILDCGLREEERTLDDLLLALPLPTQKGDDTVLVRHGYSRPLLVAKDTIKDAKAKSISIRKPRPHDQTGPTIKVNFSVLAARGYALAYVFPPSVLLHVDTTGSSVSLLSPGNKIVVFRANAGCLYLHLSNHSRPVFQVLFSPMDTNDAYLYWRLATSRSLLDAMEQDWLSYPEILVFLEFEDSTASRHSVGSRGIGSSIRHANVVEVGQIECQNTTPDSYRPTEGRTSTIHKSVTHTISFTEVANLPTFPTTHTQKELSITLRGAIAGDGSTCNLVSRVRNVTPPQRLFQRLRDLSVVFCPDWLIRK